MKVTDLGGWTYYTYQCKRKFLKKADFDSQSIFQQLAPYAKIRETTFQDKAPYLLGKFPRRVGDHMWRIRVLDAELD